jgi:hypothetical protein
VHLSFSKVDSERKGCAAAPRNRETKAFSRRRAKFGYKKSWSWCDKLFFVPLYSVNITVYKNSMHLLGAKA